MTSEFTRTAGGFALAASAIWFGALAIPLLGGQIADDWETPVFLVWTAFVLVAGALTVVATAGLRKRHDPFRAMGTVGLYILGFGVVVSFLSWAVPVWMTIQGVGMLLVALAIAPARLAPRLATLAYGSGMLVGAVLFVSLTALRVGSPDQYGDYPVAWMTAVVAGSAIVSAGLYGIGRWLRSEVPAPSDVTDKALTQ